MLQMLSLPCAVCKDRRIHCSIVFHNSLRPRITHVTSPSISFNILRSSHNERRYMYFSMASKGFVMNGRSRQNQAISDAEDVKIVDSIKPCRICQEVRLSLVYLSSSGYKCYDTSFFLFPYLFSNFFH